MSWLLFAAFNWEEYKDSLMLEKMPDMTMPVPGYIVYGTLAIGGLLLLVALYRLLTLRIFRFLFTLIAALLISYYPVAYGLHWWLYKYNDEVKKEQGYTPTEETMIKNLKYIDWGILGGGIFFGTILFYMTLGASDDKKRYGEEEEDDGLGPPIHEQVQQARAGRSGRGGSRRPAGPPQKDPFDFS